ncbi:unnamed protein product [Effrenium voratum]|uniref:CPW-WPC domain-containing protein n=1 Tax=Effrenium voratum TaxID=2562239 RepID=A0AA36IGW8_9DINO|nr:unnamed protein product [Effrenium voratum]
MPPFVCCLLFAAAGATALELGRPQAGSSAGQKLGRLVAASAEQEPTDEVARQKVMSKELTPDVLVNEKVSEVVARANKQAAAEEVAPDAVNAACVQNFSHACPESWTRQEQFCKAPRSYTGPCSRYNVLSLNNVQKQLLSSQCGCNLLADLAAACPDGWRMLGGLCVAAVEYPSAGCEEAFLQGCLGQVASELSREQLKPLTTFRQQHRRLVCDMMLLPLVESVRSSLLTCEDKRVYTGCTDAPTPQGSSGREWCYVEAQASVCRRLAARCPSVAPSLSREATMRAVNQPCCRAELGERELCWLAVVDYDALRSSAAAAAAETVQTVKTYVAKFAKAQRAAEQALDMCITVAAQQSDLAKQVASELSREQLKPLTTFRQQHRRLVDGRLCAAAFAQDKRVYTGCTDAPTPQGSSGREWCYVEAQASVCRRLAARCPSVARSLSRQATMRAVNQPCCRAELGERELCWLAVVDYDALRSSAAAAAAETVQTVKTYVAKFAKAQRAAEQALDMCITVVAQQSDLAKLWRGCPPQSSWRAFRLVAKGPRWRLAAFQVASELSREQLKPLTTFRQQHRRLVCDMMLLPLVESVRSSLLTCEDKRVYTGCTAPTPQGSSGREWCYVEAQASVCRRLAARCPSVARSLSRQATMRAVNQPCCRAEVGERELCWLAVVDYDALRSSAAAAAAETVQTVKTYVAKFAKAQRAAEQALDMYHRRCAAK